jgi:hypothetical protein
MYKEYKREKAGTSYKLGIWELREGNENER